jgi:DNA-binding response OmpR family regulator
MPGTTILIVDDQIELLEIIRQTLESADYHVEAALSGSAALELLQARRIDLIIADIAMPQMNGYQLYEQIGARPEWAAIPFFFLTARSFDSDIRYGKQLGVDDYLTKPVQPEDLLAAISGRLRRAQRTALGEQLPAPPSPLRRAGALRVDMEQHRAWIGEQQLQLSARELLILDLLVQRDGRVVTLHEMVRLTHGLELPSDEASSLLRPLVRSLRRKLGYGVGELGCIESVRSIGYRLAADQLTDDSPEI